MTPLEFLARLNAIISPPRFRIPWQRSAIALHFRRGAAGRARRRNVTHLLHRPLPGPIRDHGSARPTGGSPRRGEAHPAVIRATVRALVDALACNAGQSNPESTLRSSHRSRRFRTGVRSTGVCSTCHTRRSAATSTRRTSLRNRRCHIPCPSSPGRKWGRTCRSSRSRRLRTGTQSRCTFHRSHLECRKPGALPRSPHRVWAP
jgi:hypothetical protein